MKRFMNKKVATIGLAAGLALGAAGAAFAYFTRTVQVLETLDGASTPVASARQRLEPHARFWSPADFVLVCEPGGERCPDVRTVSA